jgi:hypothetical protein
MKEEPYRFGSFPPNASERATAAGTENKAPPGILGAPSRIRPCTPQSRCTSRQGGPVVPGAATPRPGLTPAGVHARGDLGCESFGVLTPVPARARPDRTARFPPWTWRPGARPPAAAFCPRHGSRRLWPPRTTAPAAELIRSLSSVRVSVIRLAGAVSRWRGPRGAAEQQRPAGDGRWGSTPARPVRARVRAGPGPRQKLPLSPFSFPISQRLFFCRGRSVGESHWPCKWLPGLTS